MKLYYEPMMNNLKRIIKKSTFYSEEEKREIMKGKIFKDLITLLLLKILGLIMQKNIINSLN